jgi:hypothetical protein
VGAWGHYSVPDRCASSEAALFLGGRRGPPAGGRRTEAVNGADRHVIGGCCPTWHALPLPPLLSSRHAPPSLSHHRFVIRARNHLSPLLLTSGVFSCLPAHSRLVPHTHRPFAWPEHPSNRVIACTLSLSSVPAKLDRLSLYRPPSLEHTSGGRRQCGPPGSRALLHVAPACQRPRGA